MLSPILTLLQEFMIVLHCMQNMDLVRDWTRPITSIDVDVRS